MKAKDMTGFDEWWAAYPRRDGKLAAERAFMKARKLATLEQLLVGIDVYRRNKPRYQDWKMPATWLNQGCWMDEDRAGIASIVYEPWICRHQPSCGNRTTCAVVSMRTAH